MFFQFVSAVGFNFFKDQIALVPAFHRVMKDKNYGEKAMQWLLAIHDPRSVYASYQDEKERIIAVNRDYFSKRKIDWEEEPMMIEAADALREHYWDASAAQLSVLDQQIKAETKKMGSSTDTVEIRKIVETLRELNSLRTTVLAELTFKLKSGLFDNITLKNGRKPSMLTKYMEEEKAKEKEATPV